MADSLPKENHTLLEEKTQNEVDSGASSLLMTSYLDEIESNIDNLCKRALSLAQEKDSLLKILSDLKEECLKNNEEPTASQQDQVLTIKRLQAQCCRVVITVAHSRTHSQNLAYQLVNTVVRGLEHSCVLGDEGQGYQSSAAACLNACRSDVAPGPVDYTFQKSILGCNLEDQKSIRRRLECLAQGRCHHDSFHDILLQEQKDISSKSENQIVENQNVETCQL